MKKRLLAMALVTVMALGLTACSSSGSNATTKANSDTTTQANSGTTTQAGGEITSKENTSYVLKLSVSAPASGTQADGYAKLAELVDEYTDGQIEVQIYPGSQLADKVPSMEGLRDGSIEMTVAALTDISNFGDIWGTFSLPYIFEDTAELVNVLNDETVNGYLEAKLGDIGMIPLAYFDIGSRSILNTSHAVSTPEDMKGLKIRVMQDTTLANAINAMGGNATPMAWSETYTALQQGTVDGLENSAPIITANMMHEVAKYYSLTEQFIIGDCLLMSKSLYESMPAELQKSLKEACDAAETYWNEELWPIALEQQLKVMEDSGVKINEVDKEAFQAAVVNMKEDFLSNASDEIKELYSLLMDACDKY